MSRDGVAATAERLRKIPTSSIFDVMDRMGLGDATCLSHAIRALVPGTHLAGRAYTLQWVRDPRLRADWNPTEVPTIAAYWKGIEPGDVVVVLGGDDRATGHWGEMMSTMAMVSGALGAIVDGGTRDSEGILTLHGFKVFARYTSPIEGQSRLRVHAVQIPLLLDGALGSRVLVRPGDWVVGDPEGVLVLPQERVDEIIAAAEELEVREQKTRADLLAGGDFNEVFARYGRG